MLMLIVISINKKVLIVLVNDKNPGRDNSAFLFGERVYYPPGHFKYLK